MHTSSSHQQKQIDVIDSIEQQIKNSSLNFSTVAPIGDYENDPRICLTSVHLPHQELIKNIEDSLIRPLHQISPDFFFYPANSLHMTIKNIRVINDPPNFTEETIRKASEVFESVMSYHTKFKVYFYRLLLFPNNLALIGTTDSELDNLVIDLDKELKSAGIPDDKKYVNSQYFFSNITLARFNTKPSDEFLKKVAELSQSLSFEPYTVDSVTLVTSNAVFKKKNIINSWSLK